MTTAQYTEINCKSALNRVSGMPFAWSLNPYRGCVHACQYCYARATHSYFGLNGGSDFETVIFAKRNIAAVLRKELSRPGWKRERVAIGTATDAYQPAEGSLRLTRACLEAFRDFHSPISIVTKSTLILRDIDVLDRLNQRAFVQVYATVTTLDLTLWKALEPGTPPPAKRLKTLQALSERGISTGVLMAPVIPGLTDNRDAIQSVAYAAAEAGAAEFRALPLRLVPVVKDHFLRFLQNFDPALAENYLRDFPGEHTPEILADRIAQLSAEAAASASIATAGPRNAIDAPVPALRDNAMQQIALPHFPA